MSSRCTSVLDQPIWGIRHVLPWHRFKDYPYVNTKHHETMSWCHSWSLTCLTLRGFQSMVPQPKIPAAKSINSSLFRRSSSHPPITGVFEEKPWDIPWDLGSQWDLWSPCRIQKLVALRTEPFWNMMIFEAHGEYTNNWLVISSTKHEDWNNKHVGWKTSIWGCSPTMTMGYQALMPNGSTCPITHVIL